MILKYGDWTLRTGDVGLFYRCQDLNTPKYCTYFVVLRVKSNGKIFALLHWPMTGIRCVKRVIDLSRTEYWKLI